MARDGVLRGSRVSGRRASRPSRWGFYVPGVSIAALAGCGRHRDARDVTLSQGSHRSGTNSGDPWERCRERHTDVTKMSGRSQIHNGPGDDRRVEPPIGGLSRRASPGLLGKTRGTVNFPGSSSRIPGVRDEARTSPRHPGRLGHGHNLPGPWPRRPRPFQLRAPASQARTPRRSRRRSSSRPGPRRGRP